MLRSIALFCAFCVCAMCFQAAPALAEKRVALVIGNGAYDNVSPLPNPTNDAADMAETLTNLGFEVRQVTDLGKADMESELADFADTSAGADIAVVFYAGHGMEVDRQNYLIPVDANLETDRRLRFETISLDDVLVSVEAVKGIRIVLLDACRNNPFASTMKVASASRSIGRGLSRVEAPSGTLISFAAKEGRTADDGDGRNSPFTSALLNNLSQPGVEIGFVFRKVRDSVLEATNGAQEPYVSASLPGDAIFLVPPDASPPTPPAGGSPQTAGTPPSATAPTDTSPSTASPSEGGIPLRIGEAVVTRSAAVAGEIDPDTQVVSIVDLTTPAAEPRGQKLTDLTPRLGATAREVGQVFGTAISNADGTDGHGPDIYVAASPAFGLHRNAENSGWQEGMWGADGGPGSVYVLRAEQQYAPDLFADITLDGRPNSGAGLGNLAIDHRHRQLFVSDLETGMIHRLALEDGRELDRFDHGGEGRASFYDAASGATASLDAVPFTPASTALIEDCSDGEFSTTPSCWNFADFRRRIWGIGVRNDVTSGTTRLYYALWGSTSYGNPDWAAAGNDQRNAVWSIGIGPDGGFDRADVRREFYLPDYFTRPDKFQVLGPSHPVADISFSSCSAQDVMLLAERGGIHNLGSDPLAPYARAHESRVLRYELGPDGSWQPAGRYDAGFYDRADEGPPHLRSNAQGGVSFGPGFDARWKVAPDFRNAFVWASADALCSERGACYAPDRDDNSDTALAHGLQGASADLISTVMPDEAQAPYPASGSATPAGAPSQAYMLDLAGSGATSGPYSTAASLIGDIAIYQHCPESDYEAGPLPPDYDVADVPPGEPWPDDFYPDEPFPDDPPAPGGGFPPDPGGWGGWQPGYDLAIAKSGPAECQEGALCEYQLTLVNHGPEPYFGKIAIRDEMPPGATFDSASPGWICNSFLGEAACMRAGVVGLAPGASLSVDLGIRLPIHVPGNAVQNCSRIDWAEIGSDDGAGDVNDQACIATAVQERFDLGITKSNQLASCGVGGNCPAVIKITNFGPGEFSGKLAIAETLPAGTVLSSVSGDWGCSQAGQDLTCSRQKKLAIGETVSATLGLTHPLSTPVGPLLNCARIDFANMNASDGFADLAPDVACDTVDIHHDGFDLEISKVGPSSCDDGGLCGYTINMKNLGPNPFASKLAFLDARPTGSNFVGGPGGDWICLPSGVPDEIKCETVAAVALAPGDSQSALVKYQLPNPVGSDEVNTCASLNWGVMPLDLPGDTNDQSCAKTLIGDGFDLAAGKTGGPECVEGSVCDYEITMTNAGARAFEGVLAVTDALPDGATIETVSAGWSCGPADAAGEASCHSNEDVTVLAGATATLDLGVRLPDNIIVDTIENCATLDIQSMGYSSDGDVTNDGPACAQTSVLDADLALFAGTTCKASPDRSLPCNLSVTMRNQGGRAFQGMLAIDGELDPAVDIQTVMAPGAGWQCQISGPGEYRCGLKNTIRLEPGDARKVRLVATIPAGYSKPTLTHRTKFTWPQSGKRDRNASNDATVSIVRIELAKEDETPPETRPEPRPEPEPEPQAEPEPIPEPASDLSLTKSVQPECPVDETCIWSLQVRNNGPDPYQGTLFIDDTLPQGFGMQLADHTRGWSCKQDGDVIGCRQGFSVLQPGQSTRLDLRVGFGRNGASVGGGRIGRFEARNCAAIRRPVGELPRGLTSQRGAVFAIQNALAIEGYLPRNGVDGAFGPQTAGAITEYQKRNGLPQTGRPDTATVESMLPLINRVSGDANKANDSHCARTVIVRKEPPIPACPAGSAWNPDRRACLSICRDDQRWTGERCVPRCSGGERWNGRTCVPICRDDQRWNGERCVPRCERGERWNGRTCVPVQPQCRSDQIWNGQTCVPRCGRGQRWNGEICVPLQQQCRDDQRWNGQRCVPRCERGERWNGRTCVPLQQQCRPDQRWNGETCVSRCGRGQRWNGQTCVPLQQQCRPDQRWNGETCVSRCGRGQRWNGQTCVPLQQECPAGQRWNGKSCVSICPPGQQFAPRLNTCVPVLRIPDQQRLPDRINPGTFNPGTFNPQPSAPGTSTPGPSTPQVQPQRQPQQPQLQLQQQPQLQLQPQLLQQLQRFRPVQ